MATEGAAAAREEDAAARRRALATDASFLVRAPAGSGKTELLIQRTLALLAEVERPEAVVALTFTRKAAAEMRARLLAALVGAAGPAPAEIHARQTWELARRVRARDQERGWGVAAAPARLRVMTLDALALALARRMPWSARQGGAPQPEERPEGIYREAARAALAAIESREAEGGAARRLLRQLDADLGAAVGLLAELLAVRDQWLPLLGAGGAEEALAAAVERELEEQVAQELAWIGAQVGAEHAGPWPPPRADSLAAWCQLAQQVLTGEGSLRKRPPPPFRLSAPACAALHRVRELPPATLAPEQRGMMAALAGVLPRAAAELERRFAASGRCDFTAVALAAARALGAAAAPTALAYALDGQLRHLLVDEFQDTSQAQYALLAQLVADWQPGDGRTLFLVGDPMQSIYRFRNARLELLLRAAAEERLGGVALETLQLRHNYRAQAGLVAWHNQCFGQLFPVRDNVLAGAAGFAPAAAVQGEEVPAVQLHAPADREGEAEAVAAVVGQELAAGAGAIAILVHARTHLPALVAALRRRGIAYDGVRLEALGTNQTVADLRALTRALHDPADRVAWLALLRGPWCGLRLADLHALCEGAPREAGVAELLQARAGRLSADGRTRAERTMEVLRPAAAAAGRVAPRALVACCWRALGGAACAGAAGVAAARAYLDALEAATRGGGIDDEELERALAALVAPPAESAGARVTIMTAHAAKGLEFEVVIAPGLERPPRPQPPALLHWLERAAAGGEPRWLIAARPRRGAEDRLFQYVRRQQQRQAEQEQLRLLYVIATRARRRLHWFAARPRRGAPHPTAPLARLWPALESGWHWPAALAQAAPVRPAPPLWRVPAGWTVPAPPAEVRWRAAALAPPPSARRAMPAPGGARARALGVALHRMLQRMAERTELHWETGRLRRGLRQAGVDASQLEAALAQAEQALAAVVADTRGRWLLASQREAHCEWALTGMVDGAMQHAVIDRSFVDAAGDRWVVDYKTGGHEGGDREAFMALQEELYRAQIEAYVRLVAALEPGRRVRAGLYFTALAAWREIPLRG